MAVKCVLGRTKLLRRILGIKRNENENAVEVDSHYGVHLSSSVLM